MNREDQEYQEFERRVRKDLIPMIASSAVFVAITPASVDGVDVKFAIELGLAVMMDKPIIAVVRPGTEIPDKLARVADRFVELDFGDPTFRERMLAAVDAMMEDISKKDR